MINWHNLPIFLVCKFKEDCDDISWEGSTAYYMCGQQQEIFVFVLNFLSPAVYLWDIVTYLLTCVIHSIVSTCCFMHGKWLQYLLFILWEIEWYRNWLVADISGIFFKLIHISIFVPVQWSPPMKVHQSEERFNGFFTLLYNVLLSYIEMSLCWADTFNVETLTAYMVSF